MSGRSDKTTAAEDRAGGTRKAPPGWHGEWQAPGSGSGVALIFNSIDRVGHGPALHRHPYAETFVIRTGRVRFVLGSRSVVAGGGDIVVAPAGVAHRFVNLGPGRLDMIDIHASPTFKTEWLPEDEDAEAGL